MKISKILVVDDDKLFANLLAKTLGKYKVKIVGDAFSAIDEIDQFRPDILVLDILMPGANGLNLLNELVSYEDTASCPIIICSSISSVLNPDQFKALNIVRILDKTIMNPQDILIETKKLEDE